MIHNGGYILEFKNSHEQKVIYDQNGRETICKIIIPLSYFLISTTTRITKKYQDKLGLTMDINNIMREYILQNHKLLLHEGVIKLVTDKNKNEYKYLPIEYIEFIGIAKQHPEDTYNKFIGKQISLNRAKLKRNKFETKVISEVSNLFFNIHEYMNKSVDKLSIERENCEEIEEVIRH